MLWRKAPLRAPDGALVGLIGFSRDVTAERESLRHASEVQSRLERNLDDKMEELRRSRDELRVILRNVTDGITAQDASGKLVFANDAAARLAGFETAEQLLTLPVGEAVARFDLFDEDGVPIPKEMLPGRRALAGSPTNEAVIRWRPRSGGADHWTIVRAAPVLGPDQRPILVINVVHEITEQKLAELRLRDAERRSSFLAEASAALAESLDPDRTVEKLTSMAVPRLADWCAVDLVSPEETGLRRVALAHSDPEKLAVAEELRRLYPPEKVPTSAIANVLRTGEAQLVEHVDDALLERGAVDSRHLELMRSIGLVSLMLVPLRGRGLVHGVMTFASSESHRRFGAADLTTAQDLADRAALALENARLYRDAREAVKLRDEFLSIASHELRTPLSPLKLQLQALLRSLDRGAPLDPDQLVGKVRLMIRQTDRLSGLVGNLLDVSRLAAGKLDLRHERFDLVEVVREVAERIRDQTPARVELLLDGPVVGTWDRLRVDQVLTNLVSNALKYGEGKPVSISAVARGTTAVVEVADQGIGIAAADQERIFDRFERAVSASSYGGLGLGLYIARQIVDALGGTIRVQSVPGAGARFTVELPREKA
jgi:PAS domain S-box-containing protein